MSTVVKDLGAVSAYAYAVEKGYTGTEAEFAELMADYAEVGQRAEDAADSALESKTAAQTAATTATNKASEATTAATTATNKAAEAQADADAAALDASQALSAASTATTKATEATTAAATATSAKTDAVAANTAAQSAKTAAQTAQTGAETAAASVSASAAQIATNTDDIAQLKSDFAVMQSDGVVPSADQILTDKGVTDSVPYHYRKTGGDGADRLYDQIVGGTVCFNQLVQNGNFADATGWGVYNNATISASNNVLTVSMSASANSGTSRNVSFVKGHKYFKTVQIKSSAVLRFDIDGVDTKTSSGTGAWETVENIVDWSSYNTGAFGVYIRRNAAGDSSATAEIKNVQVFDLTAMFGSTIADYIYQLEQTTAGAGVAFFKSLFPNDYYPYDSGALKSVEGLSEHKMVGFNQWNEEWENGRINVNTGALIDDSAHIRSKEFVKCLPNTAYHIKSPYAGYVVFYDSNGAWCGNSYFAVGGANFVTPNDCETFKFFAVTATYKNDICINLSDPAKNGTYEPYKAHSYPLDSTLTLRGVPKLVDGKVCFDGDTYDADGTVTRKYGIVDLGTLSYIFESVNGYMYSETLPNAKNQVAGLPNAMCSMYNLVPSNGLSQAETGTFTLWGGKPYFKDTNYTDAATFKTAMSGVMLVYELATPTTEEADPYQHLQQCDPSGTEEYVSTGIVPIGHNSFYPENLRAKVEQLPWNFANLIAPTESTFTATLNYTTGALFIVNNVLYKATSNIANGGTITPNTNCTATTLAEIISALA